MRKSRIPYIPYRFLLLSTIELLHVRHFLFSLYTFRGLVCPMCKSRNYLKHSFCSLPYNSLILSWISTKFVSVLLLYVCKQLSV